MIKHKSEIDGKSTSAHAAILAPDDVTIYEYPKIPDYSKEEGVVLVFPSQNSVSLSSFFNGAVTENVGKTDFPRGYNPGTLLKSKLAENEMIKNHTSKFQSSINSFPIKRAVFIDSTWNQSRGIYKDEKISSLKSVVLQNRLSQFWRHQKGSPRWYLSTIEAIHQFLLEVHINAWGLDRTYLALSDLEISTNFITDDMISDGNDDETDESVIEKPYNGQYDNLLFFFTYMYGLIHSYYDHNKLKSYKRPVN